MKKIIRSTNDLLLAVLMSGLSIFLLLSKKIITGVENGLGGMWAQASTYIHLLAGALTGCGSTGSSSAQEVIDYVNANPGKVTVGCTGSNNVNYGTTMELLTSSAQIIPGIIASIATQVMSIGSIATNNKVVPNPDKNIIKSIGVKNPSINCPLFVLAGIK